MATAAEQFPSHFIRHADLNGKPVKLTIEKVSKASFKNDDGEEVTRPQLHFKGTERTFGLNRTNWNIIAEITGQPDDDDWTGYQIKLKPAKTQFGTKRVDCIRVDEDFVVAPGKKGKPAEDDEANPFGDADEDEPKAKSSKKAADDDDEEVPF